MKVRFIYEAGQLTIEWPAGVELPDEGSRVEINGQGFFASAPSSWVWHVGQAPVLVEIRLLQSNPLDLD